MMTSIKGPQRPDPMTAGRIRRARVKKNLVRLLSMIDKVKEYWMNS